MIDLEKDIQYVKGIGPKKAYKLNKLGIFTLKDLLFYLSRSNLCAGRKIFVSYTI